MDAWGIQNFENDGATDFVYDVIENGKESIVTVLEKIMEAPEEEFLISQACEEGLAALEFLAAINGLPCDNFPDDAYQWISEFKEENPAPINIDAEKVLDRITHDSELRERWEEEGEVNNWLRIQENLRARLSD